MPPSSSAGPRLPGCGDGHARRALGVGRRVKVDVGRLVPGREHGVADPRVVAERCRVGAEVANDARRRGRAERVAQVDRGDRPARERQDAQSGQHQHGAPATAALLDAPLGAAAELAAEADQRLVHRHPPDPESLV